MTIVQTNEKFISKLMLISFADLSSLIINTKLNAIHKS